MRRHPGVIAATAAVIVSLGTALTGLERYVIGQKAKVFSVEALTVKRGDTVVFKNDDAVVHNVFSITKGLEFNLRAQAPGTSAGQVFKTEGVAQVRCAFHPKMKLAITVRR